MSPAVTSSSDLIAGSRISINGSALDPALAGRLVDLRVESTVGLPAVCHLRLAEDEVATAAGDGLTIIDDSRMAIGATVKVELSAASSSTLAAVFEGEITAIEADLHPGMTGAAPRQELVIIAHDRSHRMHRRSVPRTMRQVTVSDVAKKVANENGLKVGTMASLPGGAAEVIHQVDESDWTFLSRLVREHGGELDADAGSLSIVDPTVSSAPVAVLTWGETLGRLRARVSSAGQVDKVEVHGWDPTKKEAFSKNAKPKASTTIQNGSVDKAVAGSTALVSTSRASTSAEAEAQAKGMATRIGHERVQAEATALGDPRLIAGKYVTLKGVGTRFGGDHRIVAAVHTLGPGGYETRLTLGAGGRPIAESVGHGGGKTSAFSAHLVVGVVTSNGDPDKLARIKVKYPTLGTAVESDWIRVAREASGKERGSVALPEVGDEVVVGFEHGNVQRPFILGALFNGKDTPGADLVKTASSYAARFPRDLDVLTKEKTVLVAEKGLTASTKTGPLALTSGAEMTIKASEGGPPSAITIETTGQIKATGKMGVELAASGPLKITSTAPVTVESNAMLQLKGSIVQVQASGILQLSGATVMLG